VWYAIGAVVAAPLLVLLAKAAAQVTHDDVVWALAGWQLPGDFGVFLIAGDDVLAGRSPYPEPGTILPPPNAYFVYPPLLALLVAPLAVLPIGIASAIWTVLGIAAIVSALLVLDVRDWRCHLLVLLYPFTRDALEYGAVGSFLLLLVALAWRWRDRTWASATAVGVSIALKLFLWPLVVWLALTRRLRTAVLAGLAAFAVALISWAVILFRGFLDYPLLLRELSELEAEATYSTFALFRALGLPSGLAQALVLVAGLALLALAARAATVPDPGERDRRTLILTLAAALVVTPIMWLHYLVLLVIPLALTRPRLGALWLVPLAAVVPSWLGWYGGWANGELTALLSAYAIAAVVLVGTLLPVRLRTGRRTPQPLEAR
jgi:alpha-1,2-mannosyltransferase